MGYNATGGLVGTLDDFKFYNGVTTPNWAKNTMTIWTQGKHTPVTNARQ
jgi:hypothetical protein